MRAVDRPTRNFLIKGQTVFQFSYRIPLFCPRMKFLWKVTKRIGLHAIPMHKRQMKIIKGLCQNIPPEGDPQEISCCLTFCNIGRTFLGNIGRALLGYISHVMLLEEKEDFSTW